MANLQELQEIFRDATSAHPNDPNDPVIPDPRPDITEARTFLRKCEAHLWRRAAFYLDAPESDPTPNKDFTRWADATVSNSEAMARRALLLSLGSTQAETMTRAQIMGLTDNQIATGLNRVIPQMAYATGLRG